MNPNLTMIGQMISFAIFIGLTMKFIWPPILEMLDARKKTIEDGLNAATRAEDDLRAAKEEAGKATEAAKVQALEIIDQANKRASQIVEEAKDDAKTEAEKVKTAAKAEIEQEAHQAREALRGQVAQLAIVGAEKILDKAVDQSAHADMLDKLASEL